MRQNQYHPDVMHEIEKLQTELNECKAFGRKYTQKLNKEISKKRSTKLWEYNTICKALISLNIEIQRDINRIKRKNRKVRGNNK